MLVVTVFAGCANNSGNTTTDTTNTTDTTDTTNTTDTTDTTDTTEATTIQVAAIETAYGADVWTEIANAFTEATGINVDLVVDRNLEDVIYQPCRAATILTSSIWPPVVKPA